MSANRRDKQPVGRTVDETVEMLARHLPSRPVTLLCVGCRLAHIVSAVPITIRCAHCYTVTIYRTRVLFYLWNSVTQHLSHSHLTSQAVYDPLVEALRFWATGCGKMLPGDKAKVYVRAVDGRVLLNAVPLTMPFDHKTSAWKWRRR